MSWWSQEQCQHVTCLSCLAESSRSVPKNVKISADNARRLCWMLTIWFRAPGDFLTVPHKKSCRFMWTCTGLKEICVIDHWSVEQIWLSDDMWLHVMAKSKHTTSRMVVKWQMRWKTPRRQQGLVEHTSCGKDTWLADVGSSSCGSWARYGLPLQPFSGVYCLSLNLHLAGRSQCQNSQGGTQGVGDGQWSYDKGMIYGVSKNMGTPKSSILMGFSLINHPFCGTIIFGNTHMGKSGDSYFRSTRDPDVFWGLLRQQRRHWRDLAKSNSAVLTTKSEFIVMSWDIHHIRTGAGLCPSNYYCVSL